MGEAPESVLATLAPVEIEAAAARYGLRAALSGGLTARHHAPLAAFVLAVAFASILAATGLVGRRSAEIALLVSAALFMVQRLVTHRRLWRARRTSRAEIERLMSGPVTTTIDAEKVVQTGPNAVRRLDFADCREVEEANGLIYVWIRDGAPIVIPTRALGEGEAARLVSRLRSRIALPTADPAAARRPAEFM